MKYIKTINEIIKNPKLVYFYLDKIKKELKNYGFNVHYNDTYNYNEHVNIYIDSISKEKLKTIKKLLNNYQKNFNKIDCSLYYIIYPNENYYDIECSVKNNISQLIIPNKYVYHYSPSKNREKILTEGLIPQKFEESKDWSDKTYLYYKPAIFAINNEFKTWGNHNDGKDKWQINTENLKNKWFIDINIYKPDYIMTFEPIPPKYLKLI